MKKQKNRQIDSLHRYDLYIYDFNKPSIQCGYRTYCTDAHGQNLKPREIEKENKRNRGMTSKKVAESAGFAFFKRIGSPKYAVAPMVNQSELAFRMLTRKYGATLCYTPMFHSRLFSESKLYREKMFTTCPEDRPLFVQFCGDNEKTLLEAAKYVEDKCDAVDLNLGCPQGIARKGHYGAFLLEETELLKRIVSHLSANLKIPVTCKIRILKTREETIKLAKALVDAGCKVLTVHGRTKEEKKQLVGACDWDTIRAIRNAVNVPVISNGGLGTFEDVQKCFDATDCQGVMSSCAVLENPSFFVGSLDDTDHPLSKMTILERQFHLSREYLDLVEKYPCSAFRHAKKHIIQFLFGVYMANNDRIQDLFECTSIDEVREHLNFMQKLIGGDLKNVSLSEKMQGKPGDLGVWYARHRYNIKKKKEGKKEPKEKMTKSQKRKRKQAYKEKMQKKKKLMKQASKEQTKSLE